MSKRGSIELNSPTQFLTLGDGRRLAWCEWGAPQGHAVLFCHALTGSRLQRPVDPNLLERLGIRLITADRPGTGLSTPKRHRRLLDWPEDAVALLDHLGLERVPVMGLSGGGPYAMALAWRYPERVERLALVSSMGPYEVPAVAQAMSAYQRRMLDWADRHSFWVRAYLGLARQYIRRRPQGWLKWSTKSLPPDDRVILARPDVFENMKEDLRESMRRQSHGVLSDVKTFARPWGFRVEEIQTPTDLWHATVDAIVPFEVGQLLAEMLPNARLHLFRGEGHFQVFDHWAEIFSALLSPFCSDDSEASSSSRH